MKKILFALSIIAAFALVSVTTSCGGDDGPGTTQGGGDGTEDGNDDNNGGTPEAFLGGTYESTLTVVVGGEDMSDKITNPNDVGIVINEAGTEMTLNTQLDLGPVLGMPEGLLIANINLDNIPCTNSNGSYSIENYTEPRVIVLMEQLNEETGETDRVTATLQSMSGVVTNNSANITLAVKADETLHNQEVQIGVQGTIK